LTRSPSCTHEPSATGNQLQFKERERSQDCLLYGGGRVKSADHMAIEARDSLVAQIMGVEWNEKKKMRHDRIPRPDDKYAHEGCGQAPKQIRWKKNAESGVFSSNPKEKSGVGGQNRGKGDLQARTSGNFCLGGTSNKMRYLR